MGVHSRKHFIAGCRLMALPALALILTASPTRAAPGPGPAVAGYPDPSTSLYQTGFEFNAAEASCSAGACHGGPTRERDRTSGALVKDNSFTLWNKPAANDQPADPHRTASRKLRAPAAKAMARKMGIADPAADRSCLMCHALSPPPELLPAGPPLATEGVTCDACHGPSGESTTLPATDPAHKGRLALHLEIGWIKAQRAAFAGRPQDLLKKTGFYDNLPLLARARRCSACHLEIDAKIVTAGHPQPTFELSWLTQACDNRHWEDPTERYFGTRVWATGQIVALRDAFRQLADRAAAGAGAADLAGALDQAEAHWKVAAPLFSTGVVKADARNLSDQLAGARRLLPAADRRADLASAARAGADAAERLGPAVEASAPDGPATKKLLAAVVAEPAATGFGIEQQREAVFALYSAIAPNAAAGEKAKADANLKLIEEKLFPTDAGGGIIPPGKFDAARYRSALTDVKASLGL